MTPTAPTDPPDSTGSEPGSEASGPGAGEPAPALWELSGRTPEQIAIVDDRRSVTWGELEDRSNAVANGLLALGARPGSHVTLVAGNRAEFFECLLGAWRAGMAYTPAKTGLTVPEIDFLLTDAGSAVVVADRPAAREAAAARGVPLLDLDDGFEAWLASQPTTRQPYQRCGWKMAYTSGTTGRPKGVVPTGVGTVPFAEAFRGIAAWAKVAGLPGEGTHLFVSGVFHGAPLTFGLGAFARGATLRVLDRWNAAGALEALRDPSVTSTIMVPTMFRQLLALPDVDRDRTPAPGLQTIFHGGEPCPVAVKQAMIRWFGAVLVEYYGFTEGGMTVIDSDEWLRRPGSVGRPTAGLRLSIMDDAGRELPAGSEGTICFAFAPSPDGANRRFSYRNDPERTAAAYLGDAFTVGDVGWVDDDGYLFISGRRADVVVAAGVNVYPAEVEDALADTPGVADLCAVGGPDEARGEAIVLFVALEPGASPDRVRAALTDRAATALARYKWPARIEFVPRIPRDATGKLVRTGLRADLWKDHSRFATPAAHSIPAQRS
jgi:long-chain acyl-CoA synthetase